jgi:hypothetical protein
VQVVKQWWKRCQKRWRRAPRSVTTGAASGLEEVDVFVVGQQEEFFGQS